MQDRRRSSSTFDNVWSTAYDLAAYDLAAIVPQPGLSRWHRKGMSRRSERRFNLGSSIFIGLVVLGWSWSIANARDEVILGFSPTAGIIARALTDPRAPSVAYLTDAALDFVSPLKGESGSLRARVQQPGEKLPTDTLADGALATFTSGAAAESTAVNAAPRRAGIWSLALTVGNAIKPIADFSVITLKPASAKQGGKIGLYYLGNWPATRRTAKARYDAPSGFIEVTREKQGTRLSENFTLKDFFPHDQQDVWPKYIVVEMKVVDKLELILQDLQQQGIKTRGVKVLSGFRTPQYNRSGGDPRGRASLSRHMYGDAADVFIDNDGNGTMDDLNRDGTVNIEDARMILAAANRVEAAHPSLIGGVGVYSGTSAHGPFAHIDTRGYPARWIGTGDN